MGTVMTQQESNEMGIRLIHGYGKEWEFTSWKLEQWKCKKNPFSVISTPQEMLASSPEFGAKRHGNNF